VNRPSTLSLTPSPDDSTTVIFIPVAHLHLNKQSACQLKRIADRRKYRSRDSGKGYGFNQLRGYAVIEASFPLGDSIGKRTGRPPYLVTADDMLWRESRLAEGSALDPEL